MSSTKKPSLKVRLQEHLAEYGKIALVIYFSIFLLTYCAFYIAIKSGIHLGDSAAGTSGTYFAAWVATKLTQPFRIGGTFVLTPIVAAVVHKVRGKPLGGKSAEPVSDKDSPAIEEQSEAADDSDYA